MQKNPPIYDYLGPRYISFLTYIYEFCAQLAQTVVQNPWRLVTQLGIGLIPVDASKSSVFSIEVTLIYMSRAAIRWRDTVGTSSSPTN
jgi:hypothetical protein